MLSRISFGFHRTHQFSVFFCSRLALIIFSTSTSYLYDGDADREYSEHVEAVIERSVRLLGATIRVFSCGRDRAILDLMLTAGLGETPVLEGPVGRTVHAAAFQLKGE